MRILRILACCCLLSVIASSTAYASVRHRSPRYTHWPTAIVEPTPDPPPPEPEPEPPAPEPEPVPVPVPVSPPAPAPTPRAVTPANTDDFLACVKNRESRGDYTIHNTQGSGASGAYQFMPGTWNSTASSAGRSDLVGVDPAAASPADQDAMAAALYARSGKSPWGGYC